MAVASVVNTLKVLEALSTAGGPTGVTEIAQHTGVTKALAFRHLRTLAAAGYVEQAGPGAPYGVAVRLFLLGRSVIENSPLYRAGSPTLKQLARTTGLTAVLSAIEDELLVIMDVATPQGRLEWSAQIGMLLSAQHSAQGKVATAFGPPSFVDASYRNFKPTPLSPRSPDEFREEIERVRNNGWADAPGEAASGINAIAAPVFNGTGEMIGTIAVLGSTAELLYNPPQAVVETTMEAARDVSGRCGEISVE